MLNSPIEEIKNRLNIVEVVGSYIKLQKTGANFRAFCPFHSEKKPSFFVSPARQIWHCFGCSAGGDLFKFVMQIEGVEFGDALRILAQRAGVELKPLRPESAKWRTERQRLYEICELATRFFEKQLEESSVGQEAKKYLLGRRISEDSIKKYRLGYAPDTWQGLSDFLTSQGYQKKEIERAGLSITSEQGSFYDRFRGRIIFPIFDLNSQTIGFGGRIFKEKDKTEVAKYVNTPNTILYDKSKVLYGLDKAKLEIRKKDNCILVEGYTDVIMSAQAGMENVVATSGTALNPYQLKILKRYTENLTLGFDMDPAGETAAKRGIDLAQNQGFNIKVIRLEAGKDAAEIIAHNPKDWEEALEKTKSILDFYFESAFSKRNPESPEGKKEISKILLPVIKRIPNQIEKSFWVQKLAKGLGVRESDVEEELRKVSLTAFEPKIEEFSPPEIGRQKSRKELLEERLTTMILKIPQNINLIEEKFWPHFSPKIQEILIRFKKTTRPKFEGADSEYFNYLFLKAEIEEIEERDILPEIQYCLKEIQSLGTKQKLDQISLEIKKAEEEKSLEKIERLTKEFNKLSKEII